MNTSATSVMTRSGNPPRNPAAKPAKDADNRGKKSHKDANKERVLCGVGKQPKGILPQIRRAQQMLGARRQVTRVPNPGARIFRRKEGQDAAQNDEGGQYDNANSQPRI